MTLLVLRALHPPAWAVFGSVFLFYFLFASAIVFNGYVRDVLGWRHPGRPSRLHQVLWHYHTGLHLDAGKKSYKDSGKLGRIARNTAQASAEGLPVYFHPWKRWHRALRNNVYAAVVLLIFCGMVISPANTVRAVTLVIIFGGVSWGFLFILRKRELYRQSRPQHKPALAGTKKAKAVMGADTTTIGSRPVLEIEEQPKLEGVPQTVMATLLSSRMNCSAAEIMSRLKMNPDRGELILPDTFGALMKEREGIEEVIEAHTEGTIRFAWKTTQTPRTLSWVPIVIQKLPVSVRFRDHLPEIDKLKLREFGIGVMADRSMYSASHNGDSPWHCRFAGSGTGKSMGFLVKGAQICHNDPTAELYCVDTKQVSFTHLKGIPGVHVFDNPQSEMKAIWDVFYTLSGVMRDRYTAIREKRAKAADFHDIWLLVDEGNDLGSMMKSYWKNVKEETSASPAIWGEAIGPLLRLGRQARMFGEWMFQDLTDRAMGGESLKMAFSVFGAAGFLPGQFTRTIGPPAPECLEGPGRILMCRGNRRDWVQGFYDDEDWLREYALENRKEMAA